MSRRADWSADSLDGEGIRRSIIIWTQYFKRVLSVASIGHSDIVPDR